MQDISSNYEALIYYFIISDSYSNITVCFNFNNI